MENPIRNTVNLNKRNQQQNTNRNKEVKNAILSLKQHYKLTFKVFCPIKCTATEIKTAILGRTPWLENPLRSKILRESIRVRTNTEEFSDRA